MGIRVEFFLANPTSSAACQATSTTQLSWSTHGLRLLSGNEQLTGTHHQLFLPKAHLDRVNGVIVRNLLVGLTTTDRIHDNSSLEIWVVREEFTRGWEFLLRGDYHA